ncbi:MAG: transketolase [Ignavibacteria bacterium]|jgi:transketolase
MSLNKELEQKCINTIRFLAVDGVQKAKSGHPGMPMGCAPIAFKLYSQIMKHNPQNPKWLNRDRFILSAGHGSMLLYSSLHLSGYDVSMDDLKSFRQWKSKTPGHPEFGLTPGVETTTGPLGQGISNAIGMAAAYEYLADTFNKDDIKILDHFIYVIASDGDLMEGVSHETSSFAGHNKLGRLIVFYDNNKITIDGDLSLSMSEDVAKRYEGYGWQVLYINDVNDTDQIDKAVEEAKSDLSRPTIIVTNTVIGYGSPNKQGKSSSHGSPLGDEEVALAKKNLGWAEDKFFYVPEDVSEYFGKIKDKGQKLEEEWNSLFEEYKSQYPEDAEMFKKYFEGGFEEWKDALPKFENYGEGLATRAASGKVISAIAPKLPNLVGGSADLTPSNNTRYDDVENYSADKRGKYFRFGIREHAMASIMNGVCIYGGLEIYGGTFFVFSDYLRPAVRLASLSHVKPIYIFTHDSVGLGEDGPTHQPIEHMAALRAIPGVVDIRPADANETVYAWKVALEHKGSPVALMLSRQKITIADRTKYASAEGVKKGAYILKDTEGTPDIILMASGSEVALILEAAEELSKQNIKARVVSFPSWGLFEKQSDEYKNSVLAKDVKAKLAVEAGVSFGWHKYIGDNGDIISIEKFGDSAPYQTIFEEYGFNVENVVSKAKALIK